MGKKTIWFPVAALLIMLCPAFPQTQDDLPVIRVGIVMDGRWEQNDRIRTLFEKEILVLSRGEFDLRFPEEKRITADWTQEGVRTALDKLMQDPEIDLILAMGAIASSQVALMGPLPKPAVAPFVLDAELLSLPFIEGASRIKNFTYVNVPARVESDVSTFQEIYPFKKMAYLLNRHYVNAIPNLKTRAQDKLAGMGLDFQVIEAGENVSEILASLSPDVDAVYVGVLTNLTEDQFRQLADGLMERKLPSFSSMGVTDVERGILAGLMSDFFLKIARRVALNVQRILLGEEPASIPVSIAIGEQLTVNMATARAINVYPDWSVLTEAELINQEREEIHRRIDLDSAVREAIDVNLDLAVRKTSIAAGLQDIKSAKAELFPQLSLSGTGLLIDRDRAEASFGSQAQRSLTGSLAATQILFSEQAWANLDIQRSLQKSREWDLEKFKLDVTFSTSSAFLNLLRAKTFERIQRENLKRIRYNLELARVRERVGVAGPAEVYRWESEIALSRKATIQSNAIRNLAEIELNRMLHRPLEETFLAKEEGLEDPSLATNDQRLLKYLSNPQTFRIFRQFMVQEGYAHSPLLSSLDQAIRARERILLSAKNSFWLPTIAVQGEYSHILSKGGAGSSQQQGMPGLFSIPERDNANWFIGLNLTFPVFQGGKKAAARAKAERELEQLQLQRLSAAEKIEQSIRSALHLAGGSYAAIEQAGKASEAAQKSLSVVQNAYAVGAVSILHLLDSQNLAFNADQAAANAVYDFLIDLVGVERAIGRYGFFMSEEDRRDFFDRVDAYMEKAGIVIDRKH